MTVLLVPGGPRSVLLIEQAYAEEGLPCPEIDERESPTVLLYPRSYVEAVDALDAEKRYDLSFVGGLYRAETHPHRRWILEYAKRHFTDRSYLQITDAPADYEPLGPFDRTLVEADRWMPKDHPPHERAFFHRHYFEVLRATERSLCPAGDLPWSMRFFESILCRALPVVSDLSHVGRNDLERSIGYEVAITGDDTRYNAATAERNYRRFVRHQTLTRR